MKTYTLVERGKALRDIHEVIDYFIDEGSTSSARRFVSKVQQTYEGLMQNPYQGAEYQSDNPLLSSVRFIPVKNFKKYLVFYLVVEAARKIRIVRVLHGARDITVILDDDAQQITE